MIKEKKPTEEQKEILHCKGNIVVNARPGSGKTYTIVEKIAKVLPPLPEFQGVIAISFTNKASVELKKRCKERGIEPKQSFWGTIDKFYIGQIIIPFAPHITGAIAEYSVVSQIPDDDEFNRLENVSFPFNEVQEDIITKLLRKGIIPLQFVGEIALYILERVKEAMEYIKARYKYIFIDEYQDCGKVQHQIFVKLVENGITGIAVGDINQAIYGFDGRFPIYLLSLKSRKDFEYFELNKNHRCHKSISEYSLCLYGVASDIVEDDKRVYAVSVNGGEVEIAKKIDERIEEIKKKYGIKYNNNIAILCRSNSTAELISSYLKTPNKLFKTSMLDEDNSEWGRFFKEILNAVFDNTTFAMDFVEQFFSQEYEQHLYLQALKICQDIFLCDISNIDSRENNIVSLAKLIYPGKKNKLSLEHLHKILTNKDLLNSFVPAKSEEINVMTLHKSKGLEFDAVFHMDMYKYIIPNEYGNEESQLQDLNLHYVGITRAKKVCYILLGTKRFRIRHNDFIKAINSPFLSLRGTNERRKNVKW